MTIYRKIGIGFILLGIAMFIVGVSFFTYRGERLNPMISDIGMYSFFLWLPTLIMGIILVVKRKWT